MKDKNKNKRNSKNRVDARKCPYCNSTDIRKYDPDSAIIKEHAQYNNKKHYYFCNDCGEELVLKRNF